MSAKIQFEIDGHHDKRRLNRYKSFEPSILEQEGAAHRVHVLNISLGGAMVHGSSPPIGACIRLQLGSFCQSAQVRWSGASRFGVEFAVQLTNEQLDSLFK